MTNEEKINNDNNNKSIAVKEFSRACSDAWGSVWECAKEMFQRKTFVYLALACSLQVAVGLSILTFLPTFFIRSHGMSNQEAGVDIAVVSGVCGALGILMGGFACDYLVKKYHDARWYLWFMIICNIISTPLLVTAFFSEQQDCVVGVCGVRGGVFYGHGWPTRRGGTNIIAGFHESNVGGVVPSHHERLWRFSRTSRGWRRERSTFG